VFTENEKLRAAAEQAKKDVRNLRKQLVGPTGDLATLNAQARTQPRSYARSWLAAGCSGRPCAVLCCAVRVVRMQLACIVRHMAFPVCVSYACKGGFLCTDTLSVAYY
jgi:hypothetical protein